MPFTFRGKVRIQGLDWQESVLSITTEALAVQTAGNRYIASASGATWVANNIYEWSGTTWIPFTPNEGCVVRVEDEDKVYMFNGTAWVNFATIPVPYTHKTAAYVATAADSVITADATAAPFSITLPSTANIAGRQYTVKKVDASINGVTVATAGTGTIDGAASYVLTAQWQYVSVVSDGTNWLVVANN